MLRFLLSILSFSLLVKSAEDSNILMVQTPATSSLEIVASPEVLAQEFYGVPKGESPSVAVKRLRPLFSGLNDKAMTCMFEKTLENGSERLVITCE